MGLCRSSWGPSPCLHPHSPRAQRPQERTAEALFPRHSPGKFVQLTAVTRKASTAIYLSLCPGAPRGTDGAAGASPGSHKRLCSSTTGSHLTQYPTAALPPGSHLQGGLQGSYLQAPHRPFPPLGGSFLFHLPGEPYAGHCWALSKQMGAAGGTNPQEKASLSRARASGERSYWDHPSTATPMHHQARTNALQCPRKPRSNNPPSPDPPPWCPFSRMENWGTQGTPGRDPHQQNSVSNRRQAPAPPPRAHLRPLGPAWAHPARVHGTSGPTGGQSWLHGGHATAVGDTLVGLRRGALEGGEGSPQSPGKRWLLRDQACAGVSTQLPPPAGLPLHSRLCHLSTGQGHVTQVCLCSGQESLAREGPGGDVPSTPTLRMRV